MATAIGNPLGVTIFPTIQPDEDADGVDHFFNHFPGAMAIQLEVSDENGSCWFALRSKPDGSCEWVPLELYNVRQTEDKRPTLVPIKKD